MSHSPTVQARQLTALAQLSTPEELRLVRFDGTLEDLADYQSGRHRVGWHTQAEPRVGDLLISTVGVGLSRVIVSVSKAHDVTPTRTYWDPATDVRLVPPIAWSSLTAATGARPRPTFTGPAARRVLDGLHDLILNPVYPSDTEVTRRTTQCRRDRSPANRAFVIAESQGICAACRTNYLERFGALAYRALEAHHLTPLGTRVDEKIETSTDELIALCGACHNLVHGYEDPKAGLQAVTAVWTEATSGTPAPRS